MTRCPQDVSDIYWDLRSQALQIEPNLLGIDVSSESELIAIMMEFNCSGTAVALLAVADGTTSLYFGNGGGIIGAGAIAAVRQIACEFVAIASRFTSSADSSDSTNQIPNEHFVRFYFVTKRGVSTITALEELLGNGGHRCSDCFYKGQELIASIRKHKIGSSD